MPNMDGWKEINRGKHEKNNVTLSNTITTINNDKQLNNARNDIIVSDDEFQDTCLGNVLPSKRKSGLFQLQEMYQYGTSTDNIFSSNEL